MSATAELAKPATRAKIWQPMKTAPLDRWLLLQSPWNGRMLPFAGKYNHVHGGFCTLETPSIPPQQLFPMAWAEIPAFDE